MRRGCWLQDEDPTTSLRQLAHTHTGQVTIAANSVALLGMLPFLWIEFVTFLEYGPWKWLNGELQLHAGRRAIVCCSAICLCTSGPWAEANYDLAPVQCSMECDGLGSLHHAGKPCLSVVRVRLYSPAGPDNARASCLSA